MSLIKKKGEAPTVIIHLYGGIVQGADFINCNVVVEIRDYDTEGLEEGEILTNEEGEDYYAYNV